MLQKIVANPMSDLHEKSGEDNRRGIPRVAWIEDREPWATYTRNSVGCIVFEVCL